MEPPRNPGAVQLSKVPNLSPDKVKAQVPFKDLDKKNRRMDFAIIVGPVRVAIEVDGFDKTGEGGMNNAEFNDFLQRQNALEAQGWRVLRFSNTDVRDKPRDRIRTIQQVVEAARAREVPGTDDRPEWQGVISKHWPAGVAVIALIALVLGVAISNAVGGAGGESVVIVEVNYNAPGDDNENMNGEWVTIRNTGTGSAVMTGWMLEDESTTRRYHFSDGFTLAASGQVQVFTGCGTNTSIRLYWCSTEFAVWNNTGDTAFLLDPGGNVVDSWSY